MFLIEFFNLAASYFPLLCRVSSPRESLTSEFGMRSGVSPLINHQIKTFNRYVSTPQRGMVGVGGIEPPPPAGCGRRSFFRELHTEIFQRTHGRARTNCSFSRKQSVRTSVVKINTSIILHNRNTNVKEESANTDCDFQIPNRNRRISTSWLKRLLALHLKPINLVIS